MKFKIVYDIDVPENEKIEYYLPVKQQSKLFTMVEDYSPDEYASKGDYSYLGKNWKRGAHKKLCATLDRDDFQIFLATVRLHSDPTETGGIISIDGWSPAILFRNGNNENAICNAYVMPIPDKFEKKSGISDREETWNRVKTAIVKLYARGY